MTDRLRKADWTVRDIEIGVARRMVEKYHYAAGASNTACKKSSSESTIAAPQQPGAAVES